MHLGNCYFETDKSPFIYQIIPQSGIIEYKSQSLGSPEASLWAIERSKGVNGSFKEMFIRTGAPVHPGLIETLFGFG